MKRLSLSRQLLYAVVIILVVTNVVTVISVMRFLNDHKEQTEISESGEEAPGFHRTKIFSDELNLDKEQHSVFRDLNRTFNQTANHIYRDLSHQRLALVNEMGRTNPDSSRLQKISIDIGDLHTELKMLTTNFYMGLKEVCSPEQQNQLFNMFRNLLNTEKDLNTPRGRGSGRGYGRVVNPNIR